MCVCVCFLIVPVSNPFKSCVYFFAEELHFLYSIKCVTAHSTGYAKVLPSLWSEFQHANMKTQREEIRRRVNSNGATTHLALCL